MKLKELEELRAAAFTCGDEVKYLNGLVDYHFIEVMRLRAGIENILASNETETSRIILDLQKLLEDSDGPAETKPVETT